MSEPSRRVTDALLLAVHERDVDAVVACFLPAGSWQNVPEPPVRGHEHLRALFEPILARSSEVCWEVRSAAYEPTRAWLERVDRFVIDGRERAAHCHGVFELDVTSGLLVEVRDYVDLAAWRRQLADVRW